MDYISGATSILKREELYKELQLNRFIKYEKILDSAKHGKNWLSIDAIADKIYQHLLKYDGTRYRLIAFTIMPNHLHIILIPIDDSQLETEQSKRKIEQLKKGTQNSSDKKKSLEPSITRIMRLFKGATANSCNKILKRKGQFWQHESYDHQVRGEKELKILVEYTLENPVKAGLIDDPYEYRWNYYNPEYL
ncbi:MAG: hypothetical protein K9J16_10650 [Melioribacteraceae bacterium]|nr:hypothetical protein [Melioribacteraceae bacterium]